MTIRRDYTKQKLNRIKQAIKSYNNISEIVSFRLLGIKVSIIMHYANDKAIELLRITNSKITNLKCRIIMLKSIYG